MRFDRFDRCIAWAVFCTALFACTTPRAQSPHEQGVAAGNAAKAAIGGMLNAPSAASVVPGYSATAAESAYAGRVSLGPDADARLAACALDPADLTCQAMLGARASAMTPRPPVHATDPSIAAARAITRDPSSAGVSLASVYSGCTTRTELVSAATQDRQSCYQYLLRSLGNGCGKDLVVSVDWQCPAGASSGPTREVDPGSGAVTWTCTMPTPREEAYCVPPLTGPELATSGPFVGKPVCEDKDGKESLAPLRTVIDQIPVAAAPLVSDSWANGCAGYEARVPPGYLPPDGVDLPPAAVPPMAGPLDKCARISSVCSAPAETRIINDHPVTRSCWGYWATFDCVDLDPRSDCAQPRSGACTPDPAPVCIDHDTTFTPAQCTAYRQDFWCQLSGPVVRTVQDCGAQTFCSGASCFDASHPPDPDFARSVAFMEVAREAGRYLDPATMRVFKGFDNRCRKKLFGLVNCCNKGGSASGSLFTNFSIASAAAGVGKAVSTQSRNVPFSAK